MLFKIDDKQWRATLYRAVSDSPSEPFEFQSGQGAPKKHVARAGLYSYVLIGISTFGFDGYNLLAILDFCFLDVSIDCKTPQWRQHIPLDSLESEYSRIYQEYPNEVSEFCSKARNRFSMRTNSSLELAKFTLLAFGASLKEPLRTKDRVVRILDSVDIADKIENGFWTLKDDQIAAGIYQTFGVRVSTKTIEKARAELRRIDWKDFPTECAV